MIDVLCVAGTGEHAPPGSDRPVGLLAEVTRHLDEARFAVWNVAYPASYGPVGGANALGLDYVRSVEQGVQALLDEIRSTTNRVGLLGYSQGATVVSRLLEGIERGDYPDVEIAFAGLVANPTRADGWESIDGSNLGYGIAGEHGPWPSDFPIWEVAQPRDPICSLPGDSLLRSFADLTEAFSVADPGWWAQQLAARIHGHGLQAAGLDVALAISELLDYAMFGQHAAYATLQIPGVDLTYTEELAHLINETVRE
ncbi:PE-PPE domain-containing protein [Nocardia sp. NPDC056611]|uniref:PE-PPE domain-containing protein n=1 Tax=Nocardia sp. NPDC056611 TaxID=3345877 RepID=UPI00366E1E89